MQTKRVIALGFFDGVHIGHGALLRRTCELATNYGCISSAFSFDVSPSSIICGIETPLISSVSARITLMQELYGIEDVQIVHFDKSLMRLSWQEFVTEKLQKELHAVHVVCGQDFRFGYRGEGTPERLKELCKELGIGCDVIEKVELDGVCVSSTVIRNFLQRGDFRQAVRFLGHPLLYCGVVQKGARLGQTIGVPTANLPFEPNALTPAFGVYAAKVEADGSQYRALVNVGLHPTAEALKNPLLEAHLLDFSGDLYGKKIFVRLYDFIRPERKFSSLNALQEQIRKDRIQIQNYFSEEN